MCLKIDKTLIGMGLTTGDVPTPHVSALLNAVKNTKMSQMSVHTSAHTHTGTHTHKCTHTHTYSSMHAVFAHIQTPKHAQPHSRRTHTHYKMQHCVCISYSHICTHTHTHKDVVHLHFVLRSHTHTCMSSIYTIHKCTHTHTHHLSILTSNLFKYFPYSCFKI